MESDGVMFPDVPSLLPSPFSELTTVVGRLQACQVRRDKAESRLSGLQQQAADLQRAFPWPGLGERRQAAERAQNLLDQASDLAPVLADVRTQVSHFSGDLKTQPAVRRNITRCCCFSRRRSCLRSLRTRAGRIRPGEPRRRWFLLW